MPYLSPSGSQKEEESNIFKNTTLVGAMKYQTNDSPIKISVIKKAKPPLNKKRHQSRVEDPLVCKSGSEMNLHGSMSISRPQMNNSKGFFGKSLKLKQIQKNSKALGKHISSSCSDLKRQEEPKAPEALEPLDQEQT